MAERCLKAFGTHELREDALKDIESLLSDFGKEVVLDDRMKRTADELYKMSYQSGWNAAREKAKEHLEAIKLMVESQAKNDGLWSVPIGGLQPIVEAYLQQELRRLHECVEHYANHIASMEPDGTGEKSKGAGE
jgi:hypothetical protein